MAIETIEPVSTLSRENIQNIVLKHMEDALKDTVTVREQISNAFYTWFQSFVEVPKIEDMQEDEEGGGEEEMVEEVV